MDFCQVLSVAQKNSTNKQNVSYYPSKFKPPKKETKQTKSLSENIRKFLAKKEEEEKKKAVEEKRKKENLLAMRDHKAQSRINKHLKVCKSANKSVLADAINTEDTAVTLAGPSQPDEDDYGYVSQEASTFYNQLMNKYKNLPPDKPLFSDNGKRMIKDIASTKDRVKQALKQQEIDDSFPHRRKRKSDGVVKDSDLDNSREGDCEEKEKEKEKNDKIKKKRSPGPPPMDFMTILKLAEKKQYEPIVFEPKPKPKPKEEVERPMTKKQKKEYMKEKEWKEKRERERNGEILKASEPVKVAIKPTLPPPQIPPSTVNKIPKISSTKPVSNGAVPNKLLPSKPSSVPSKKPLNKSSILSKSPKDEIEAERRKLEAEKRELENMRRMIEDEKKKLAMQSKSIKPPSNPTVNKNNGKVENKSISIQKDVKSKQLIGKSRPVDDSKLKATLQSDVKVRKFPPQDVKPRQFPPPDVKNKHPVQQRKPLPINKRRIYDDDDEDYDSEMDDFIDDDEPVEQTENYSKYISEIFGYDRNKYKYVDDDDDNMESNFAQQLKEEFVSTKIGIMEDLEDIRQEALEKKRKAMMMKKLKKK